MNSKEIDKSKSLLESLGFKLMYSSDWYCKHRDLWIKFTENKVIAIAHNGRVRFEVENFEKLEELIRN